MNKEFRVWIDAVEPGKFIYPESITFYKSGSIETPEYRGGIVQQWTGLTDSTGKKIFEGDIVLFQEKYKYQIYWLDVDASFDLALVHDDESFFHMPTFRCGSALQMKVIGNIFETPELLK